MWRTEATKAAAVSLIRNGKSVSEVAKLYKVSATSVRVWIKKAQSQTLKEGFQRNEMVPKPEVIAMKQNLERVREALTTLAEAGLI